MTLKSVRRLPPGFESVTFPPPRLRERYRMGVSAVNISTRPRVPPMALHATTIRFADRAYTTIARAADAQGISVSQYVREAALIRAVLDELDSAEDALHTAHDLLAVAREVRLLAQVDPPGPPRRAD